MQSQNFLEFTAVCAIIVNRVVDIDELVSVFYLTHMHTHKHHF